MENIYDKLIELSKSAKAQNLFIASKEVFGIKLFRNNFDFSKLQEIYLANLYNFESINRDIIIDKISERVLDNKIYWDSYLIWKRKNIKKMKVKDNKQNDVNLVVGKEIKFPTKGK